MFLFCASPTHPSSIPGSSCMPKEGCLVGKGRTPGLLAAQLQVGTTYLLYVEPPLVAFLCSTLIVSCCNQSPRWFPQETRPVVKLTIFLGTILQTWCPCSWLLHPCPSISSLVQTAHFWGLFACELINILFLFYPVPSLHLFPARVICSKSSSYHFTFKYFSRHLWITHNHNFIVIPNNKINISVPSCLKNIFF